MKDLFSINGSFWGILNRFVDLVILNFLFIICCVPIVTIGASKTALYDVAKRLSKNEEGYIFRSFLKSFKNNFKASTIMWLIYVTSMVIIGVDLYICTIIDMDTVVVASTAVIVLLAILINMTFIYSIVLQSTFENTLKNTVTNGFIISVSRLPFTVLILLVEMIPVGLIFFLTYYWPYIITFLVVIGFSVLAYVNSFIFNRVLENFKYCK